MFCVNFQDNVIKPAVKLQERMLVSTHHFYLDVDPFIVSTPRAELEGSPDFIENLHKLHCENILQNRKQFNLAKIDPEPTREALLTDLTNVMTVVPGLYMRQVGRQDAIREPTIVRKQRTLVAWGTMEKKEKFVTNNNRTLMSVLYFASSQKHEKPSDSMWAPWKQIIPL
jgi:hypothetical protein